MIVFLEDLLLLDLWLPRDGHVWQHHPLRQLHVPELYLVTIPALTLAIHRDLPVPWHRRGKEHPQGTFSLALSALFWRIASLQAWLWNIGREERQPCRGGRDSAQWIVLLHGIQEYLYWILFAVYGTEGWGQSRYLEDVSNHDNNKINVW